MRNDVIKIKESTNTGIDRIQKKFKDDLNSNLFEVEGFIDDQLDHLDEDRQEILSILNFLNEELKDDLNSLMVRRRINVCISNRSHYYK